ncbi:MAG: GNAT family N-acetyltransferase [Pseudomonadota bacterium]
MTAREAIDWLSVSEVANMAALHAAAFRETGAWEASAIEDLLRQPTIYALGMYTDAELMSFLIVQIAVDGAEILTLATHPERQRKGLAARLLAFFERHSPIEGLQTWLLDVAADNQSAIAFYAKLGFQVDGRRPEYYKRLEGQRIDAILMSKSLAGQAT